MSDNLVARVGGGLVAGGSRNRPGVPGLPGHAVCWARNRPPVLLLPGLVWWQQTGQRKGP